MPLPLARPCLRLRSLLLFVGALVLARAGLAAAEDKPAIGPAPDWVRPSRYEIPAAVLANPNGQDFLLVDQQARVATQQNYHHHVLQIVSDAGREDASQVYYYFDPSYQKLTIHHLKVVRGSEVFDRLDAAKIQVLQQERDLDRQMYNGQRSALVILDDVRLGDIIDTAYTLEGGNPVFGGHFIDTASLGWAVPVRHMQYRLVTPPDRLITAKVLGPANVTPHQESLGAENSLTWTRHDLGIIEVEDRVPSSHQIFPYLDLSEYKSWPEVVAWALPLYATEGPQPAAVEELVRDLRGRKLTPEQQAVAALAFVQQEIRYLGIEMGAGSHRPSEPEEVLRRRFGDCKDQSRLLVAVLRQLGLTAAPALVHSTKRRAVLDRLPTPYAFDHVIVALDLDGKRHLLDPTLTYQRGDSLALRHVGRYGPYLRVSPDATVLEMADFGPGDATRSRITQTFRVPAFDQPAELVVTTKSEGRAADNLRAFFATRTRDQIDREYLNYYTQYYSGITRTRTVETHDSPADNTYTTTEYYRVGSLFSQVANAGLRAEFEPPTMWDYSRIPNLAQRSSPFSLSHPVDAEERVVVHLPEEWNLTPEKETVEDEAFVFSFESTQPAPRTVSLDYRWTSRTERVPAERLAEFADKAREARKQLGYHLTWNSPGNDTPSSPPLTPLHWPMVMLAVGMLLTGGVAASRVARVHAPRSFEPPLLDTPPLLSPPSARPVAPGRVEGLGGWLILVAVGLLLRPFWLLKTLYDSRNAYFDQNTWHQLTHPGSESFSPHYAWVVPLEMLAVVALLVFSALLIVLFFRRSHLFPPAMQAMLAAAVAFSCASLGGYRLLGQEMDKEAIQAAVQTTVAALIWIPYLRVSVRVKNTFTR